MDKNKVVCHLTSVHPVFDIRIFYKQCISLVKNGYDVTLIAPASITETNNSIKIVPVNLSKLRFARMLTVTFKMLRLALKQKAKLYHFHDPELMLCGVLLKLFGKKVIFDIHENVLLSIRTKEWIPAFLRTLIAFLYFLFERFAIIFYDKLVLAEESYAKYYPARKSAVVLNYPINKDGIQPYLKEFVEPICFIYSGVVHPLRGLWEMLELIKMLKEKGHKLQLDVVGEMRPASIRDEIDYYLHKYDLTDSIIFHGKVDFKEVALFLKNGDIGLSLLRPIPNYVESLPTKIFEYMQHGLPVITNDFPLYKKHVEDEHTGICVDIENLNESAGKISIFINNKELLKKLGYNGMKATSEKFNWNSQEKELLRIYNNLIQ